MRKICLLFSLVLVLVLAVPAAAGSNVEFSGDVNFMFWEFTEVDGKADYSMNGIPGAVFGIGGWKQDTSDNNVNRERLQTNLNLNMKATVDNIVTVDASLLGLHEEMNMDYNGTDKTYSQGAPTPQDNEALRLGNLTITAKPDFGEVIITNNFNYNFNNKVLASQFRDDWGDMVPYGEGVLVKNKVAGVDAQSFLYKTEINDDPEQGVDYPAPGLDIKQMVYGIDLKRDIPMGKVGALLVRTYDERADEDTGDGTYDKDLHNNHIAVTGELSPVDMLTINGEFITAMYGEDVDTIYNTVPSWDADKPGTIDLSAEGAKEDTNVIEVGATLTPIAGLEITGTYKDVGEDYVAVQNNSHKRQSWLGDESFGSGQIFNYKEGIGYEKGFKIDGSYMLPVALMPQITGMYTEYDETRSHLNDGVDDSVSIAKVGTDVSGGAWETKTYYRWKNDQDAGEDKGKLFNEINVNGSYTVLDTEPTELNLTGELSYYTGDDEEVEEDKNFSQETRVRVGTNGSYKLNNKTNLTASYDFGVVREDSDLLTGSAMQNLVKTGVNYKVSPNTTLKVNYQFDSYQLKDVNDDDDNFAEAMEKKEADHVWYDGDEEWGSRDASYEGYTTHSVKATYNVSF